jgi:SAM-dependent methyltransferase
LSRNSNYNVIGLEKDKTLVADCRQIRPKINRFNLQFICADAQENFPIKINFDIIFSTHVLEHISNDQAVLVNTFNSLKPGGILILQVPYGNPERKLQHGIANGHVRDGYFQPDLLRKLENAGFEIISTAGSVGKIGRFAYKLAMQLSKIRVVINFSILFFPITLILIYLEQLASSLRNKEPSFKYGPLIVARHPL